MITLNTFLDVDLFRTTDRHTDFVLRRTHARTHAHTHTHSFPIHSNAALAVLVAVGKQSRGQRTHHDTPQKVLLVFKYHYKYDTDRIPTTVFSTLKTKGHCDNLGKKHLYIHVKYWYNSRAGHQKKHQLVLSFIVGWN